MTEPMHPEQRVRDKRGELAMLVEGVLLVALGVAGVVVAMTSVAPGSPSVLLFRLNAPHAAILLGTGVCALAAAWKHKQAAWFAGLQALIFGLLFVFGTHQNASTQQPTWLDLNLADSFLHAGLSVLGLVLLATIGARAIGGGSPGEGKLPGHRGRSEPTA